MHLKRWFLLKDINLEWERLQNPNFDLTILEKAAMPSKQLTTYVLRSYLARPHTPGAMYTHIHWQTWRRVQHPIYPVSCMLYVLGARVTSGLGLL